MNNPHFERAQRGPSTALKQVEATLALAYEARTANLITLHQTTIHALTNGFELEDKAATELEDLAHQIETRLGLGETK